MSNWTIRFRRTRVFNVPVSAVELLAGAETRIPSTVLSVCHVGCGVYDMSIVSES